MDSKAMETLDLHASSLLATVFNHPSEVLADPLLPAEQKRCILAAWASDAFAVEGKPWLREIPGSQQTIPVADIMAALRRLDDDEDDPSPPRGGHSAFPIALTRSDVRGRRYEPRRVRESGGLPCPSRSESIAA